MTRARKNVAENKSDGNPEIKLPTRSPGFTSVYANHVLFEVTQFDLRIVFGEIAREYDLNGKATSVWVEQRTSVTLAWLEAKVAALFMLYNVAQFESENGPVALGGNTRPAWVPKDVAALDVIKILEAVLAKLPAKKESSSKVH